MNGNGLEDEGCVEWEPLFDVGCVSGHPVTPRDDCGQQEPAPGSVETVDEPVAGDIVRNGSAENGDINDSGEK